MQLGFDARKRSVPLSHRHDRRPVADVVDRAARRRIATVDVAQQASGIAFWKMGSPTAP